MPELNFNAMAQQGPRSVYEGFVQGGQIRNQLAQQEQARQLADIQLQNALRAQRLSSEEEAAYKAAGGDLKRLQTELMSRGLGKQSLAVSAQLAKQRADQMKMFKDTVDLTKGAATQVMANPQNATQILTSFGQRYGIDMSDDLAQLQQLGGNPDAIRQWAAGIALEADKLLPQFETKDVGGELQRQGYNRLTGAPIGEARVTPKTLTPGEARPQPSTMDTGSQIISRVFDPATGTFKVVGTTAKTLTPGESRTAQQENNVVANTITDAAGNVTLLNRFGQVVQPQGPAGTSVTLRGKPSATFEKTTAQREQVQKDLSTAISELKDATKDGGLIDQSTGSGVGRAVDVGARVFGKATEGDIAIGKLKPIADIVLKMVPRFEGPQSDKDTQSYKEAAGQLADPGMPRAIRKEAAKTIIRLMENRKSQFVTNDMAAEGTGPGGGVDTSNPLLKK